MDIKYEGQRIETFERIAELQAKSGDFGSAIKTANSIRDVYSRSQALAKIAESQAQVDKEGANRTFNAAVEITKDIRDTSSRWRSLLSLAKFQKIVDKEGTKRIFDVASRIAEGIDNKYDRSRSLLETARSQAESGNFDSAIHTTRIMDDYYERSIALAVVAELQADAGDFIAALETSETISQGRISSLYNITRAIVRAGDREQFKKVLTSSAQELYTAYQTVGLLFEVYKDQSRALSEMIRQLI